jgi:hypothetical protein
MSKRAVSSSNWADDHVGEAGRAWVSNPRNQCQRTSISQAERWMLPLRRGVGLAAFVQPTKRILI